MRICVGGFWPLTNHGTGFTLAQQHQETSPDGPEDDIIVIDELQQELRAENNLMLRPYIGDLENRPRRTFIPHEDITEGKFVILRPDDAFEAEIPIMIWLGRTMGAVVQKLDDEHHGEFLVKWWRPKHRKSTNATNKERSDIDGIGLHATCMMAKTKEDAVCMMAKTKEDASRMYRRFIR
ncbi:hypothetical protein R1sor_026879 [Riccia sorocarpa]|uniref:Uncharacterized protein n=1 Tax=Riccia sorocarpa TaxID=122646 RepID=A0ABD3GGC4_9MARC